MHKTLKEILGPQFDLLDYELVVEPQRVIHLKPKRPLTNTQWQTIDRKIVRNRGCWDQLGKEWMLPDFIDSRNLSSASKKRTSSRLYIRDKTLQNLLFLQEDFRGKRIESWRDIQEALSNFRPERRKYSKSTCRDYLGALLALARAPC